MVCESFSSLTSTTSREWVLSRARESLLAKAETSTLTVGEILRRRLAGIGNGEPADGTPMIFDSSILQVVGKLGIPLASEARDQWFKSTLPDSHADL